MVRYILILVAALFLIPGVFAAVSDVSLTYADHQIETLGEGVMLSPASFSFVISGEEYAGCESNAGCRVNINLQDFAGQTQNLVFSDCDVNGSSFTCELTGLTVESDDTSLEYVLDVFAPGGIYEQVASAFSITLDSTTPTIDSLRTGYCEEDTCFVGSNAPTMVTAVFNDTLTSYDYQLVKFAIGDAEGHATECEAKTCSGVVETQACSHGQSVEVKVVKFFPTLPSSEDALNPIDVSRTIQAECDATPPTLNGNTRVESTGPTFDTASPMRVEADGTSDGVVQIWVDHDNLTSQDTLTDCSVSSGTFQCDIEVTGLNAGTHTFDVVVQDGVGNAVREEHTIEVLIADSSTVPNFFDVAVTGVVPNPINRVALDLATRNNIEYPLFVDFVANGPDDAEILQHSLESLDCRYGSSPNSMNESSGLFRSDTSYVMDPSARQNRFFLNFAVPAAQLDASTYYVQCSYDIFVRNGDSYFSTPERENFTFTINFANSVLGTPGQAFVDELKRAEEDLDGGINGLIDKLQKIGSVANKVCGIYGTLSLIEVLGNGIEKTGLAIPVIGPAITEIGSGIFGAAGGVNNFLSDCSLLNGIPGADGASGANLADGANDNSWLTPDPGNKAVAMGFLPECFSLPGICDWWTCSTASEKEGLLGNVCGGVPFTENAGTSSVNKCVPNYKDSLLTSLGLTGGGFCAQGVIYNLGKWQAIDCGYVACLKEQASYGANINVCKQGRAFKQCTQVTGEIFELPVVNIVTRGAQEINHQLQNAPMTLLQYGFLASCKPGTFAAGEIKKQIIQAMKNQALNLASGGLYGAYAQIASLLNTFGIERLAAPALDIPVQSLSPNVKPDNFLCHAGIALYHLQDYIRLQENTMDFDENLAVCELAECEGTGCNRGGYSKGGLSQFTDYAQVLQLSQTQGFTNLKKRAGAAATQLAGMRDVLGNQNAQVSNFVTFETTPSGTITANYKDGFNTLTDEQKAKVTSAVNSEVQFRNSCAGTAGCDPETGVISDGQSSVNLKLSTTYSGPNAQAVGAAYNQYSAVRTSFEQGSATQAELDAALNNLRASCGSECNVEYVQAPIPLDPSQDRIVVTYNTEVCDPVCRTETITVDLEETHDPVEAAKAQAMQGIYNFVAKWLYDSGYLDALKLSGWGDWGEELSSTFNQIYNPDEWKNNLCSEDNDVIFDDEPLVALASDEGAVMTLAGEVRDINDTFVYTVSIFVRVAEDNRVRVVVGDHIDEFNLTAGESINYANSINLTESVDQLCVQFEEGFPESTDDRQYCRPFVESAYNRGGMNG